MTVYLGLARTVYTRYFWQGNHQIYGHIRCLVIQCFVISNIYPSGQPYISGEEESGGLPTLPLTPLLGSVEHCRGMQVPQGKHECVRSKGRSVLQRARVRAVVKAEVCCNVHECVLAACTSAYQVKAEVCCSDAHVEAYTGLTCARVAQKHIALQPQLRAHACV